MLSYLIGTVLIKTVLWSEKFNINNVNKYTKAMKDLIFI